MEIFTSKAFLLFLFALISILYFPINKRSKFGFHTESGFDKYIPFVPLFIIPYIASYILGIIFMIVAFTRQIIEFQQFIFALSVAAFLSYIIFIFFPTSMIRPEIKKIGFLYSLIKFIYKIDKPHNVMPSGHVFYTTIFFLFFANWYPEYKIIFVALVLLLYSSTVFVKQHYLSNVFGGIILGVFSYLLAVMILE